MAGGEPCPRRSRRVRLRRALAFRPPRADQVCRSHRSPPQWIRCWRRVRFWRCTPRPRHVSLRSSRARRPVTLQNHVRVRPREPERAHTRAHRSTRLRPRRRLRCHPQRQPLPVHPRTRPLVVQMPRNHPVTHRQHRLDQTRHPRRRLQVTDVRLHRTDQQRSIRGPTPPVCRRRRMRLHRVTKLRPRPVRLQVVHLRGRKARTRQRLSDHPLLRRTARHRQSRTRSVLVHRRAAHHRPDAVPRRLRVRQALQNHHPAAFPAHVAVGRRGERLAPAVRRQHPGLGEDLRGQRRQDRVHPARQREVALAALQARHRLVQRHQRRRAGGVHRQRRSFQPQGEGDAPDRGAVAAAGRRVEGEHIVPTVWR